MLQNSVTFTQITIIATAIIGIVICLATWYQNKDFRKEIHAVMRILASAVIFGMLIILGVVIKSLVSMAISGYLAALPIPACS